MANIHNSAKVWVAHTEYKIADNYLGGEILRLRYRNDINNDNAFQTFDILEALCHKASEKIRVLPPGVGLQEQASKTAQASVAKSHGGDRLENRSGRQEGS